MPVYAFTGARKSFLDTKKSYYNDSYDVGDAKNALANILRIYCTVFPLSKPLEWEPTPEEVALALEDDQLPDDPELDQGGFTEEEWLEVLRKRGLEQAALLKLQGQLQRWFSYRYIKANGLLKLNSSQVQTHPLSRFFRDLEGTEKKPRLRSAINVWRQGFSQSVEEEARRIVEEGGSSLSRGLVGVRSRVAKQMFSALSLEDQEHYQMLAKEEHQSSLAAYEANHKSGPSTTPEARQSSINSLARVVQPILDAIVEATGWRVSLIAGGPEPVKDGQMTMLMLHSGTTIGDVKMDWGRFEHKKIPDVLMPMFGDFLRKCYSIPECQGRTLDEESGPVPLPTPSPMVMSTPAATSTPIVDPNPAPDTAPTVSPTISTPAPATVDVSSSNPTAVPSPIPPPVFPAHPSRSPSPHIHSRPSSPTHSFPPSPRPSSPRPSSPTYSLPPSPRPSSPRASSPTGVPCPVQQHLLSAEADQTSKSTPQTAAQIILSDFLPMSENTRDKRTADNLVPEAQVGRGRKKRKVGDGMESLRRSTRAGSSLVSAAVTSTSSLSTTAPPPPSSTDPPTTRRSTRGRSSLPITVPASSSTGRSSRSIAVPVLSSAIPTTAPAPGSSLVAPTDAPATWFIEAMDLFVKGSMGVGLEEEALGSSWVACLEAYSLFQRKHGFGEGVDTRLPASLRPSLVKDWISRGRTRNKTWRPKDFVPKDFKLEFAAWWTSLQPAWRVENGAILRDQVDGDWSQLVYPGVNGLLSVMAALFFWGLESQDKAWCAAVEDCTTAFKQLASIAS